MTPARLAAAALLVVAAASPTTAAAAEEDTQFWTTAIATGPIAGDLAVWAEVQTRFVGNASRLGQFKLRGALGYRFREALTVYGGYAHITNHRPVGGDVTERRLRQQASYAIVTDGPVRVTGRTRLEQRFVEGGGDTGWRLRQQMRLSVPLGTGRSPSAVVSGEALIALNSTDWGAAIGLDQLRGFIDLNVPIGRKQAIDLGYLNQSVRRADAVDPVNHVGLLSVSHRF